MEFREPRDKTREKITEKCSSLGGGMLLREGETEAGSKRHLRGP